MTNYRRLISYIYAYEGEVKGKNIGFAKLESRNGQCKLSINVKKVYVGSSDLGVYLLAPGKEIFLGNIFIRGGSGEFRAAVSVDNAADSGCSMDLCYGLTIHEQGDNWRAYTTIWEDAVAHAAELELAEVTSESLTDADAQIHKKMEELHREIQADQERGEVFETVILHEADEDAGVAAAEAAGDKGVEASDRESIRDGSGTEERDVQEMSALPDETAEDRDITVSETRADTKELQMIQEENGSNGGDLSSMDSGNQDKVEAAAAADGVQPDVAGEDTCAEAGITGNPHAMQDNDDQSASPVAEEGSAEGGVSMDTPNVPGSTYNSNSANAWGRRGDSRQYMQSDSRMKPRMPMAPVMGKRPTQGRYGMGKPMSGPWPGRSMGTDTRTPLSGDMGTGQENASSPGMNPWGRSMNRDATGTPRKNTPCSDTGCDSETMGGPDMNAGAGTMSDYGMGQRQSGASKTEVRQDQENQLQSNPLWGSGTEPGTGMRQSGASRAPGSRWPEASMRAGMERGTNAMTDGNPDQGMETPFYMDTGSFSGGTADTHINTSLDTTYGEERSSGPDECFAPDFAPTPEMNQNGSNMQSPGDGLQETPFPAARQGMRRGFSGYRGEPSSPMGYQGSMRAPAGSQETQTPTGSQETQTPTGYQGEMPLQTGYGEEMRPSAGNQGEPRYQSETRGGMPSSAGYSGEPSCPSGRQEGMQPPAGYGEQMPSSTGYQQDPSYPSGSQEEMQSPSGFGEEMPQSGCQEQTPSLTGYQEDASSPAAYQEETPSTDTSGQVSFENPGGVPQENVSDMPVIDAGGEELALGDPRVLERLEEEEQKCYQPRQVWDGFRKQYPKITAFDSANGCEILSIKPQDIGLLPRENWNYGNNSFLLHGYYNYRYLILARIGDDSRGRVRYILGVPGHYYSNEKYMASMFGFPHFVLSKKQPSQDGRFGYWYTDVRLENQD